MHREVCRNYSIRRDASAGTLRLLRTDVYANGLGLRKLLNYLKYPTTIRVVSSTSVRTTFSVSISARFNTVLCATASIVLTQINYGDSALNWPNATRHVVS